METVLYRRSKLLVKTIPKGTLLFRLVKNSEDDLRGVKLEDGKRCITPNYNVFFHPNPFIGYLMYHDEFKEMGDIIHIYILIHDVKVLLLVNPSQYNRLDYKRKKRIFMKPCSTVKKGCLPKEGKPYDTCLSKSIIENHPEIVGSLAISAGDQKYYRKALKRGINHKTLRTFKNAKDSFGVVGVPELSLHPLTKRPSKDMILNENDKVQNNYRLLKKLKYNEKDLQSFMQKHAEYDPDTYFYTYKE